MDKLVKIFTNKWLKLGVSLLSVIYPAVIGYEAWLFMGYYFEPTHNGALYTSYIFINLLFFGIMFYTRHQIITRLCTMITPLLAFAVLILGFDNWFYVIPPIVVCVLAFFFSGTGETMKTVVGTVYLIMYVVGVLVFLTVRMLIGRVSLLEVDLSLRSTSYLVSPDGQYRVVTYVQPERDTHRTVSFYLETTDSDISLPFLECKKALGAIRLITSDYRHPAKIEWKDDNTLYIDGRLKEFTFDADTGLSFPTRDEEDDTLSKPQTTKVTTTKKPAQTSEEPQSADEGSAEED